MASNIDQLAPYILPLNDQHLRSVKAHWPGPVTFVMKAAHNTSELLTGGRDTIAVRVSDHPVVRALCEACGMCITSTSANQSGQEPIKAVEELTRCFGMQIDSVVPGTLGGDAKPTRIIDLETGRRLR